tara:strand:+ start:792 stop:1949 length:1158 start_codon:yes stop_codon:yes gene_type:complete
MKKIGILGSTGSIGTQALQVTDMQVGNYAIKYLTAYNDIDELSKQAIKYKPEIVCIVDKSKHKELENLLSKTEILVVSGRSALLEIASRDDVDLCINGLVGAAGMGPTIEAIKNNVDIALANKESLVMAGQLINNLLLKHSSKLLPVDSEHSAIWQCLIGEDLDQINRIILTGSGGPFRTRAKQDFNNITIKEALQHPNWSMGNKITIDSATMMNKGLEVIEAHWLFGVEPNQIEIIIHPESIVHSLVEFVDGSIKAQLGLPDMKIPIQYALTYPKHSSADWETLKLEKIKTLNFEEPDFNKFSCLNLAYYALNKGGSAPVVLNVANDKAVEAFLNGYIPFLQIPELIEESLNQHEWVNDPNLEKILEISNWTSNFINDQLKIYA